MEVLGKGSLVQRDMTKPRSRCRKWELSVRVRENGKKKPKTRAFHGTYSQGLDALAAFVDELKETPVSSDMPFSDWVDLWCKERASSGAYSKRTLATDRDKLACALSSWKDTALGSITSDDVRELYTRASQGDTPSGRKWSAHTISRMHTTLSKLFSDAVERGVLAKAPTKGVKPPKVHQSGGKAIPSDQMDSLLASLDYSRCGHRAVALALGCGLRRSEICGLKWDDIRDGCVHVERSSDEEGKPIPTKTAAGVRTVPMPASVADGMESVRGNGRVCPVEPYSLSRWWRRNKKALGCGEYRFHDLRHSYATRLAENGVHVRVAMQLCGWSSVEVAMKVYTHVSDEMTRDAVRSAFG